MFIYKITNKINNKCYIGQTTKDVNIRFKRHLNDALSNRLNTNLACAIRKYGKDAFTIETIEQVYTQEELDDREIYWIHYYDSLKNGYNMTDGAINANTYKNKTVEEMMDIKKKLKESKLGAKNPNSKAVKCKNINTNEELHFDSLKECMLYFKETNHNFITRRCNKKTKFVYKGMWIFAYENDNYINDYSLYKNIARNKKIIVKDLITDEEKEFISFAEAERYFKVKNKAFSYCAYKQKNEYIVYNRYKIIILN